MFQSFFVLFIMFFLVTGASAFEVKGEAISTSLCSDGKCDTQRADDQVIYDVNLDDGIITRTAIFSGNKHKEIGGLQSDNTKYQIIFADEIVTFRNNKPLRQKTIKGVGQTGVLDGFETIAIGEDYIHTSRSSSDYFVLYFYKRTE